MEQLLKKDITNTFTYANTFIHAKCLIPTLEFYVTLVDEVGDFDGEVESCNFLGFKISALMANFTFWSGLFINHCLANILKIKEKPIRKTIK